MPLNIRIKIAFPRLSAVGLAFHALSLTAWLGGGAAPATLHAEETQETEELRRLMSENVKGEARLDTTITSVGKRHQKLSETAAAIYVVTQEDLRRSGVTNLPDALRLVPGLNVARIDSNKWAVSARGFNGRFDNKLLVLMDGREVYNPTFGGVYWEVQNVPLYDIDRIEVIRGPGASLWGANAVNGVINIITKPAGETLGGRLTAGGGSYEKYFGSFRYGHQFDEATAGRVWAQGFERGSFNNVQDASHHDDWGMATAGFRLDRDAQQGNIWLLEGQAYSGTVNQTLIMPSPEAPYHSLYGNRAAVSGFNLLGRWKTATSLTSELTLQGFYDHSYRNELYLTQERDTLDLDFQHRFLWGDRHNINWGLGYRISWDRFGNTEFVAFRDFRAARQLFSAFLQDDIALLDDTLTLTLGSKLQRNDYTGFEIQPSLRLAWNPDPHHSVWGALSRAVRIPSRLDTNSELPGGGILLPMSQRNPTPFPALVVPVGNTRFSAERVIASELGYRFKPNENFSVDVALFYNDYAHLRGVNYSTPNIQFVQSPQAHWQVQVPIDNSMDAQSYGVEWLTNGRLTEWWKTEVAYTFLKTHFQSRRGMQNFSTEEGFNPQQQVSFRSSFDLAPSLDLDVWVRYVDRLPFNALGVSAVPDYLTLDTRLAWRPFRGIELSVVGQNLLQPRHVEFEQEALGPPRSYVPRSVYVQFDWRF